MYWAAADQSLELEENLTRPDLDEYVEVATDLMWGAVDVQVAAGGGVQRLDDAVNDKVR
jgi:hypothetical protein